MALKAVYERFLSTPTADVLSADASWNYITTTTSFTGSDQVIKHLSNQQKVVKKKGEKTLSVIQTPDAIVLDVETTLEFVTGGGAYLPSLDDNFLADRVVVFPTVHVVRFNAQNQIQHVRIYWDQGSLLKQVDVIGSRGKNWPIRDGKEQSKLIANITTAQGIVTPPSQEDIPIATGKIAPYAPGAVKPPHDPSEAIFGTTEALDNESTPRARDSLISHRAGASKHFRPVRVFGEDEVEEAAGSSSPVKPRIGSSKNFQPVRVFDQGETEDVPGTASPVKPRLGSSKSFQPVRVFDQDEPDSNDPHSENVHQPRAGSTKNFHAVRVFDIGDGDDAAAEKELRYKTNPNKFGHFEIGAEDNGAEEAKDRPAVRSRPMSQWDFSDFTTPDKPRMKLRAQDVRHFGWSDNEEENVETPPVRPRIVQPRRDAATHFQIQDEDDAENQAPHPQKRMVGSFHNKGLGLYDNNLYDEEGVPTPNEDENNKHASSVHAGIVPNNEHRKKDFDRHWEVTDPSPEDIKENSAENVRPVSSDRVKAVKMMSSSWDTYDESPESKKTVDVAAIPAAVAATPISTKRTSRAVFQSSWSLGGEE